MADRMKSLAAGIALLMTGPVMAQLADPTRPPPDLSTSVDPSTAASATASGLQSIIIRKTGQRAALINGEVVELGGKVGDAKLVKIAEDRVVLKGPEGEQTLRLMPAAEKKATADGAAQISGKEAGKSKRLNKGAKQ